MRASPAEAGDEGNNGAPDTLCFQDLPRGDGNSGPVMELRFSVPRFGLSRSERSSRRSMQLTIRDLSKTYPNGTRALKGISLDVPPGMFGLLGRNGAGKSTLMRILATLQEPDEGTIRLGELDVIRQKDR